MSDVTFNKEDVTLSEESDQVLAGEVVRWWSANLDGELSIGAHVNIVRHGTTAVEALANLYAAAADQGWSEK